MMKGALAEKKFLESKDKLFKMVESGQMSQEHFVNVFNEFYDEVKPQNKNNSGSTYDEVKPQNKKSKQHGYDEVKPQSRRNVGMMRSSKPKPNTGGYDEVTPQNIPSMNPKKFTGTTTQPVAPKPRLGGMMAKLTDV